MLCPQLFPRKGPRPMPYHLGMTSALLTSSVAALPMLRDGSLPWAPHLAARGAHLTQVLQLRFQTTKDVIISLLL